MGSGGAAPGIGSVDRRSTGDADDRGRGGRRGLGHGRPVTAQARLDAAIEHFERAGQPLDAERCRRASRYA